MIYFIPFLVLILIYINTSSYEHFFLCQLENKVLNSFGGDSYFGKLKSKVINYESQIVNKFNVLK